MIRYLLSFLFLIILGCESSERETSILRHYCETNDDCKPDYFCKKDIGDCDGVGVCEIRPEYCLESVEPSYYKPVCGCDGDVYPNECYAYRVGVNIKSLNCEY